MTTGIHGHGAVLSKCATTAFTTVTTYGQIVSIAGPNHSRDSIDISNMDSTAKWREFLTGIIDAGELSCEVVYDGTTIASGLKTEFTNPTAYWRVLVNDGTDAASCSSIYSAGFITALGHEIPFDDAIKQSVSIKLTGAPVFTASS